MIPMFQTSNREFGAGLKMLVSLLIITICAPLTWSRPQDVQFVTTMENLELSNTESPLTLNSDGDLELQTEGKY